MKLSAVNIPLHVKLHIVKQIREIEKEFNKKITIKKLIIKRFGHYEAILSHTYSNLQDIHLPHTIRYMDKTSEAYQRRYNK